MKAVLELQPSGFQTGLLARVALGQGGISLAYGVLSIREYSFVG